MNRVSVFALSCAGLLCVFGFYSFNFAAEDKKREAIDYSQYRKMYAKDISQWERPNIDNGVAFIEMSPLPKIAPDSKENPYSEEKKVLGEMLFNERKLSKSGQFACASCHNPELSMGDGIRTSFGHDRQRGNRNAPNIMMSGFFNELFWDGRADSLESQALQPITNPIEMANDLDNLINTLKDSPEYYTFFILAFGNSKYKNELENNLKNNYPELLKKPDPTSQTQGDTSTLSRLTPKQLEKIRERSREIFSLYPNEKDIKINYLAGKNMSNHIKIYAKELITTDNIAKAIASYERTLVPKNTRFNRFLNGQYDALNDKEIYGLHIFRTKGRCMNCHFGAALSDGKFHNIGLSFYGRELQDLGRYEVSGDPKDVGAFKTPSLIAVSKSAPYMHNGIFPNLRGLLNLYNAGFPVGLPKDIDKNDPLLPKTTELIKPLNLTIDEIEALESFLGTL